MTIASEIQRIKTNIANAYTACDNKGATMPATQNSNNLASCVSSIPTATEPILASLTVTPSTTAQTLTPPSNIDGYNTVTVSAVTSAIDSDIVAGNIKSGVNILGITGTVTALAGETRTVSITSTSGNTFTPSSGKNGITSIKCNPTNKALTITPTTTTQTFTVPSGYSGYGTVTCGAGTQPSGTYTITANGTYDVTNYASADVNVSGGGGGIGITREVSANGVYQMPASSFAFSLPSNATDVGKRALYYILFTSQTLTSVDLSSLTTVSGEYAMYYAFAVCENLTSVDLSSLTTVSGANAMGNAFDRCKNLVSVDLSNLRTVTSAQSLQQTFSECVSLTSIDLSNLTTVSGRLSQTFKKCTGLISVDLSNLTTLGDYALTWTFNGCTNLKTLAFPALTSTSFGSYRNQFNNMLSGVTGCTVHFPSNLQSVIGSWSDVTSGFGGKNTTVLFDLPATT